LSSRELAVLDLLADGCTNREIAQRLFIAQGIVKAHVASVYRKLEVHSRAEAVSRARDLHLLE
jgi:LuxR family transcriptional regulator, maltose regulon positive regulatory protein